MVRYIPLELNSNCCFLHVTPHSDCFTNWQSAWKNSCCITEPNRISCLNTYQLVQVWNLFKQNHTSWYWYPIFFWKIHTNLELILDLLKKFHFKADFWLVCGRCILGIETNMALLLNWYIASSPYQASTGVWSWYYLMFLQCRFWYEVGIASDHTNMMSSLVSRPVLVHIPCQLGTHSTLISTMCGIRNGPKLLPVIWWFFNLITFVLSR